MEISKNITHSQAMHIINTVEDIVNKPNYKHEKNSLEAIIILNIEQISIYVVGLVNKKIIIIHDIRCEYHDHIGNNIIEPTDRQKVEINIFISACFGFLNIPKNKTPETKKFVEEVVNGFISVINIKSYKNIFYQ